MAVSAGGPARVQRDSPAAERAITVRDIEEIRLFQQKLATASPTERPPPALSTGRLRGDRARGLQSSTAQGRWARSLVVV